MKKMGLDRVDVMSEYQYYEFQSVDRQLTAAEKKEIRSYSSRAKITSTSFVNHYSYADFRGDADLWMEKYFDGFLYYANWGTHELALRLPASLLDIDTVKAYCHKDGFEARQCSGQVILNFRSECDSSYCWDDEFQLASFLGLRAELSRGDLRCLYLGWLAGVESAVVDEEELEPPVPPGLQNLSPALEDFADFLRISSALIAAAAANSPSLEAATPSVTELQRWIAMLPPEERDQMLAAILVGSMQGDQSVAMQQVVRFTKNWQQQHASQQGSIKLRTVADLLNHADEIREHRARCEAERQAQLLAEQQRQQELARQQRLNEVAGKEPLIWDMIDSLASEKKAKSYDRALELLTDLRDLAARTDDADFLVKLGALKKRHSAKYSFVRQVAELIK